MIKIMKELKRFQTMRRIEKQDANRQQHVPAQAVPKRGTDLKPVENMARMAMPQNQSLEKHGDLKKQSQFAVVQLGAKSYIKRDYGNIPANEVEENKANQACPFNSVQGRL